MAYQNKKILVVEDDDLLRRIITNQLSANYTIISAADGEEALQQTESQRPDIIVLDLLLPKLDGFGFLEKLRNSPDPVLAKTVVLVVSNLSDPKNIERASQYKVLEYYIKSDLQLGILLNRVNRYFAQGT